MNETDEKVLLRIKPKTNFLYFFFYPDEVKILIIFLSIAISSVIASFMNNFNARVFTFIISTIALLIILLLFRALFLTKFFSKEEYTFYETYLSRSDNKPIPYSSIRKISTDINSFDRLFNTGGIVFSSTEGRFFDNFIIILNHVKNPEEVFNKINKFIKVNNDTENHSEMLSIKPTYSWKAFAIKWCIYIIISLCILGCYYNVEKSYLLPISILISLILIIKLIYDICKAKQIKNSLYIFENDCISFINQKNNKQSKLSYKNITSISLKRPIIGRLFGVYNISLYTDIPHTLFYHARIFLLSPESKTITIPFESNAEEKYNYIVSLIKNKNLNLKLK